MQANSRSACQFWHQREKESRNYTKKTWKNCLFLSQGVKHQGYFRPTGRCFRADFQNVHYTWAWNPEFEEKSQNCKCTPILSQRVEIKLIFPVWAAVFEIRADFQNFHIWTWNLKFEGRCQSWICTLFLPQGVEIKLIFAVRAAVFGMISGIWRKVPKLHMYSLSAPRSRN